LQVNLPGVAVHDLLVKDNDLVIGTHSRGFWILDDVTPLRQITNEVKTSSMYLFTVAPAYRLVGSAGGRGGSSEAGDVLSYGEEGLAFKDVEAPNGGVQRINLNAGYNLPAGPVITYYFQNKPVGEVTLTIKDEQQSTIRRFSSTQPGPGEPRVPAEAGTNRFIWDMRYPNARELSPAAALSTMEWPRATAPVAPPGKYSVEVSIAGQTRQQPFEIRKDPRLSWSDAQLVDQVKLWMQVRDEISETTDTVNRLRAARKQVEDRARQVGQERVNVAAERIKAKLATIEAGLTRTVGANPMLLPPKGLHQKFATLTNIIGSGDGAPTRWTYAVVEELSNQLADYVRQLNTLIASEIADFLRM
jgi:hypothetical protein